LKKKKYFKRKKKRRLNIISFSHWLKVGKSFGFFVELWFKPSHRKATQLPKNKLKNPKFWFFCRVKIKLPDNQAVTILPSK
tara:strand:+ start:714 stop:956 length:243 start_codon:yes stop_codon:yes gene_type:complete